jgi:hypothetical protein
VNVALSEAVDLSLTPRPSVPSPPDDALFGRGGALEVACGLAATSWGSGPPVLLAHGSVCWFTVEEKARAVWRDLWSIAK